MVPDAKEDVAIERIEVVGDQLIVEGHRPKANTHDESDDLALDEDLLRLFFQVSPEPVSSQFARHWFALNQPATGQAVVTLFTRSSVYLIDIYLSKYLSVIYVPHAQVPHPRGAAEPGPVALRGLHPDRGSAQPGRRGEV